MTSGVHPTAEAGWQDRGAEDYERGRPGYPRAAVELIGAELGVEPGTAILDLAAGTGKLTRELGLLGARVIAVEPLPAMRAQLASAVPDAEVLDGRAEAIPLADGSVHAVTVAQAFHWFDVPAAAAEIARVLDDGGGLAVVRNEWNRDVTVSWETELREYLGDRSVRPQTHERDWRAELDATGRFAPFTERSLRGERHTDLDGLVHQVASMSFIAALPDDERGRLLDGARTLLQAHGLEPGVEVAVPVTTIVRWARVHTETQP